MSNLIIIALLIALIYKSYYHAKAKTHIADLQQWLEKITAENKSKLKSISVRNGFLYEQWFPLSPLNAFKDYDMRYLGQPIDYVAFGEDKIVFVELKTGTSQLTTKQKSIASLVKEGKVEFIEVRMEEIDDRK